jgi:plastocyanin
MLKRVVLVLGVVGALGGLVGTSTLMATGPSKTYVGGANDDSVANPARLAKGKSVTIDGVSYANHGTKDVRKLSKLELEADDYYFSPTFLRGRPGQKLTLIVESEGRALHNISIPALGIDKNIPPRGKVQFEVTFPPSAVLAFTCKFHAALGMNGQLVTGENTPVGALTSP